MCAIANPLETAAHFDTTQKQTVEMRSPDGSADVYFLMAGLCVACRYGLEQVNSLEIAQNTYVDGDIHSEKNRALLAGLEQLPTCCVESGDWLEKQRTVFEAEGVFNARAIDGMIANLRKMDDKGLYAKVQNDEPKLLALVEQYFHCG
jgi:glutamine synthetase